MKDKVTRVLFAALVISAVALMASAAVPVPVQGVPVVVTTAGAEQGCVASGGTVITSMCCKMTGDFPNTCLIGACGCSPANSHPVKYCRCPAGKCFNGNSCVKPGPIQLP